MSTATLAPVDSVTQSSGLLGGGLLDGDLVGSAVGSVVGSVVSSGFGIAGLGGIGGLSDIGCLPDFSGLVEPIMRLVPAPLQPGLTAILDSGAAGLAVEVVQTVGSAVLGQAGSSMLAKLGDGASAVELLNRVQGALDKIAGRACAAVSRAIEDLGHIAIEALAEIGAMANPVALLGPGAPLVLAEMQAIGLKHLGRAKARLRSLGRELLELGEEATRTVVLQEAIPASPQPIGKAPASSSAGSSAGSSITAPTGSAAPEGGEAGSSTGDADAAGAPTGAAAQAVAAAKTQLGTPYVWGGTTPGEGFDCSGLVQWAYGQAGVDLPRLADQQAVGPQIPQDQVQPGDLAVWDGHVAMVIEDGQLLEAGDPVGISPIRTDNIGMNFLGFYRPTG